MRIRSMRIRARIAIVLLGIALSGLLAGCFEIGVPFGDDESTGSFAAFSASESGEFKQVTVEVQRESAVSVVADSAGNQSAELLGRQIILNGHIRLRVNDVMEDFDQIAAMTRSAGGYVENSNLYGDSDSSEDGPKAWQGAYMSLRIPAELFEPVKERIQALAVEVLSVSTDSEDVTAQVTDFESDLRNRRAVENQYLSLLEKGEAISDIVAVTDRLNDTRREIERIESQLATFSKLVALATLSVELEAVAGPNEAELFGPLDAARAGWEASWVFLETLLEAILAILAFSWWLIPLLVLLALLLRRLRSRRIRRQSPPAVDPER